MNLVQRILQKPPVAFPLIALFHFVYTGYLVYDNITEWVGAAMLVQPLYMLLYAIAWLFICDFRKWAVYAYTGLTMLNLALRYLLVSDVDKAYYTDVIFPADIVFSMLVFIYFKRFD